MNRRPKLSLISSRELKKKQALDFGSSEAPEKEPDMGIASEPAGKESCREPVRPVRLVSEQEKMKPQESNGRPDGKVILKAVVVVATFALSVYLLKRRFL